MKKGKVFAVAGVTLLAAGLLAACSSSNTSKASSRRRQKLWLCLHFRSNNFGLYNFF